VGGGGGRRALRGRGGTNIETDVDVVNLVVSVCDPIVVTRNIVVKTQSHCECYYALVASGGISLKTV
jgi:hypothetical protein